MRFTYFAMYILITRTHKSQDKTPGDLGFEWAEEVGGNVGGTDAVMRRHKAVSGEGQAVLRGCAGGESRGRGLTQGQCAESLHIELWLRAGSTGMSPGKRMVCPPKPAVVPQRSGDLDSRASSAIPAGAALGKSPSLSLALTPPLKEGHPSRACQSPLSL